MSNKKIFLTWPDDKTGLTVEVEFDVVTSDSYEAVMEVTSHPVEKGAPVVDHAREQPLKLSIEAFVSNTPLPSNLTDEERIKMGFFPVALDYGSQKPPKPLGRQELNYPPSPSPSPTLLGATSAIGNAIDKLTGGGLPDSVVPTPLAGGERLPETMTVFRATGEMPDRARAVLQKLEDARKSRSLVRVSTRFHDIDNMLIEQISVHRDVESAGGLPLLIDLVQVRIVESQTTSLPIPSKPRAAKMVDKGSQQLQESTLFEGGVQVGAFKR